MIMFGRVSALIVALVLAPASASAEFLRIEMRIFGMD